MGIIGKVVTFIPSIAIDHISEFESIRTLLRVFTFQWSSKTPLNGMFCEVTPQSHSKNFNSILKLKQKCHKLMNSIWALLFTKYVPFIMNHRQSTEIWRGLFKLKNEFPPRIHSWKKSTWKHSHMDELWLIVIRSRRTRFMANSSFIIITGPGIYTVYFLFYANFIDFKYSVLTFLVFFRTNRQNNCAQVIKQNKPANTLVIKSIAYLLFFS